MYLPAERQNLYRYTCRNERVLHSLYQATFGRLVHRRNFLPGTFYFVVEMYQCNCVMD